MIDPDGLSPARIEQIIAMLHSHKRCEHVGYDAEWTFCQACEDEIADALTAQAATIAQLQQERDELLAATQKATSDHV